MTTSRLVEATQFTMQEYDLFKAGQKFDNKFRQAAMEIMAKDEKNPKSELNKLGMKEVRRIRVMREASDMEGKSLTLVYETKTDKRELAFKAYQVEQKKAANVGYTFPFWLPDVKKHLTTTITQLVEWIDAHPIIGPEAARKLEEVCTKVSESKLDREALTEARVEVYRLLNDSSQKSLMIYPANAGVTEEEYQKLEEVQKLNQERDTRTEYVFLLDYLASALLVLRTGLFEKESLLKYSRTLLPPRPPNAPNRNLPRKGEKQKQRDGDQQRAEKKFNTPRQSNGNHAKTQQPNEQVEKKPESAQA